MKDDGIQRLLAGRSILKHAVAHLKRSAVGMQESRFWDLTCDGGCHIECWVDLLRKGAHPSLVSEAWGELNSCPLCREIIGVSHAKKMLNSRVGVINRALTLAGNSARRKLDRTMPKSDGAA